MSAPGSGGFWRRLVSLTRKEVRQLLRDRANLMMGIALPIVLILIFGYGLSLDVKNAPVAVVLDDASPVARDVVAGLSTPGYLAPRVVGSAHEAYALMRAREVDAAVLVPADFSRRLAAGDAQVQVLLQGADASRATMIRGYVAGALASWSQKRADRGEAPRPAAGQVQVVDRMWFNAANNSTWYLVPGLIVLIMTLVGAFLTALVMAREWERARWSRCSSRRCGRWKCCWPRSFPISAWG